MKPVGDSCLDRNDFDQAVLAAGNTYWKSLSFFRSMTIYLSILSFIKRALEVWLTSDHVGLVVLGLTCVHRQPWLSHDNWKNRPDCGSNVYDHFSISRAQFTFLALMTVALLACLFCFVRRRARARALNRNRRGNISQVNTLKSDKVFCDVNVVCCSDWPLSGRSSLR